MKPPKTQDEAREYLRLVRETDYQCEYGHFGCAAWEHGPCSDELTGLFNLYDSEE